MVAVDALWLIEERGNSRWCMVGCRIDAYVKARANFRGSCLVHGFFTVMLWLVMWLVLMCGCDSGYAVILAVLLVFHVDNRAGHVRCDCCIRLSL